MKEALEPPSNWNQKEMESVRGNSARGDSEQRGSFDPGISSQLPPSLGAGDVMGLQWACNGLPTGLQQACNRLVIGSQWACNGLVICLQQAFKGLVIGLQ